LGQGDQDEPKETTVVLAQLYQAKAAVVGDTSSLRFWQMSAAEMVDLAAAQSGITLSLVLLELRLLVKEITEEPQ
jgi:hypothetical protein